MREKTVVFVYQRKFLKIPEMGLLTIYKSY